MKVFSILILSWLFLSLSCKNRVGEQAIIQSDSLVKVFDGIKDKFSNLDSSAYMSVSRRVDATNAAFAGYKVKFPTDSGFVNKYAEYTLLLKVAKRLRKEHAAIQSEIIYSGKQLRNLNNDLKKNTIREKEKIDQYLSSETKAVTALGLRTENYIRDIEHVKFSYGKTSGVIEPYIEKFKKKN